ncbi:putative ankyrin repeat-containing domain-containing protein [Medicago truncatula]|uniref:Putative ankyrin repeat-containing domain-containing protein n=1 Tax=Medicago truncatula TaxID=3880 RepID=A0A396HVE1_MEDTR|nr:putative ankyrin repeat-containing domain-containing protein [Medicago truncatula]
MTFLHLPLHLSLAGETNRFDEQEQKPKENEIQKTISTPNKTKTETKLENEKEEVDKKETPFLVAAKNGIVELVNEFLDKIPSAIHDTNSRKENVLHVAVKSRQPVIVETLRMRMIKHSKPELWNNLILAMDKEENTILHLAAKALGDGKPWQIAGSALQMMWDIKWFQVHTIITTIFTIIFKILLTYFEVSFLTLIFLKPLAHVGLTYFRFIY